MLISRNVLKGWYDEFCWSLEMWQCLIQFHLYCLQCSWCNEGYWCVNDSWGLGGHTGRGDKSLCSFPRWSVGPSPSICKYTLVSFSALYVCIPCFSFSPSFYVFRRTIRSSMLLMQKVDLHWFLMKFCYKFGIFFTQRFILNDILFQLVYINDKCVMGLLLNADMASS